MYVCKSKDCPCRGRDVWCESQFNESAIKRVMKKKGYSIQNLRHILSGYYQWGDLPKLLRQSSAIRPFKSWIFPLFCLNPHVAVRPSFVPNVRWTPFALGRRPVFLPWILYRLMLLALVVTLSRTPSLNSLIRIQ